MASKVMIASLLLACFACAYATEVSLDGKDGPQGLSVTVIGGTSPEKAIQSQVDHVLAWTNFGKGCKCEEKCVDRVKNVCKATLVPEEKCEDVEKEIPIVKCKTVCITPEDGKTVLITLPSLHGRKLFTDKLVLAKSDKDASLCKEVCEDSTKKEKEKKCKTEKKEKLDCKEVKDGQECEKVCSCNGIVTKSKKVPLFSLTKGH